MRTSSLAAGLDRGSTPGGQGPPNGAGHYHRRTPPLSSAEKKKEAAKEEDARDRKGFAALEQRVKKQVELEDKRVKELTEAILYDFVPTAMDVLLPKTDDPASELHADRCRAVAGAALCVGSLMNAPPGFLEFLLCVPWTNLAELYPRDGTWNDIDAATPALCLDEEARRVLVNTRLHPQLLDPLLRFMYREENKASVPPTLRLAPTGTCQFSKESLKGAKGRGSRRVTWDAVCALLDDVTPLHCAAIRGNPAQVDHLMYCGADPTMRSGAGELPLEMVLLCGGRAKTPSGNNVWSCHCMTTEDAEVWECRTRLARTLIARKCVLHFASGIFAWLHLLFLSLLCMIGLWGCPTSIDRSLPERHEHRLASRRREAAMEKARTEVGALRDALSDGHDHLAAAVQGGGNPNLLTDPMEPVPPDRHWYSVWGDPPEEGSGARLPCPLHGEGHEDESSEAARRRIEAGKAVSFFARAVQILEGLGLRTGIIPRMLVEAGAVGGSGTGDYLEPPGGDTWWNIPEEEQADVYCGWAESVLLKHRTCGCRGCKALAVRAIGASHFLAARVFARVDKGRAHNSSTWRQTGIRLARIIHTHACLLLDTQSRMSPTRSVVGQSQTCLQEWENMKRVGLAGDAGLADSRAIAQLDLWTRTAEADLRLVEAMAGHKLDATQPLGDVVAPLVLISQSASFFLSQSVTKETATLLEEAAEAAPHGTKLLLDIVRSCARNARREIAASDALKEVVAMKGGAVEQLAAAIDAAAVFPSLLGEVREARQLKERWERRAEAMAQLETVMEAVRHGPEDLHPSSPAFWDDWAQRIAKLEGQIEEAREANVSVNRAKRLVKDMQAQAAAAEAAARLEEVLQHKPCGSGLLKGALAKAEAAASTAAATGTRFAEGTELLLPALAAGRRQLEMERAAENLSRAAASASKLADLPRLEAAILAARKIGAQELDPEAYRVASDLRATLDAAARARGSLEAVLRGLGRGGRSDDADAVETAIAEAEAAGGHLLEGDVERAREALQRWRGAAASEAKLARALRDGANTAHLARTIQEAAAAGVKVADAKRVLKLMQSLEAAMAAGAEGPGQAAGLRARVDAAEQGGVTSPLLIDARARLARLMLAEAKTALESALNPRANLSSSERAGNTATALERAEQLLRSQPVVTAAAPAENDENVEHVNNSEEPAGSPGCGSGPVDAAAMEEDVAVVQRMVVEARKQLAAEAAEQERIERERAEEQRLKREQQRAERAERERERQERAERDKIEREKAEKERAERREKERAERSRLAKEQAVIAERQRREKQVMDRLARQREEAQQRARRAVPITMVPASPARGKQAPPSPGPRPSPVAVTSPDNTVVQVDPMVVGVPLRTSSRSDWSDEGLSGHGSHSSSAVGEPLQRSTSLDGRLPSTMDAMLGYPGSGNFSTNVPPPLANGNSLRSSEPSTEDLPAFDMWGNLAHIPSKYPEVPHSYFSKADPPPLSAALTPVPHSAFPAVGSLLGAATAGFLGRVGSGDALHPAIPRPAPASGAAGLVARLTNFWSTSGSPPRAAPPQRTFSPEPSLGSATTSVERSVNSVSSDTATPRPKYADLGGASWRGVQLWNPSPSPAPTDTSAPLTPASLWAPQTAGQSSAPTSARGLTNTPKELDIKANGWAHDSKVAPLNSPADAQYGQQQGMLPGQTLCRYSADAVCQDGMNCPFSHLHPNGSITPPYDTMPLSSEPAYANNIQYSNPGISASPYDQHPPLSTIGGNAGYPAQVEYGTLSKQISDVQGNLGSARGTVPHAGYGTVSTQSSDIQSAYGDMMHANLAGYTSSQDGLRTPIGAGYMNGTPGKNTYFQGPAVSPYGGSESRGLGGDAYRDAFSATQIIGSLPGLFNPAPGAPAVNAGQPMGSFAYGAPHAAAFSGAPGSGAAAPGTGGGTTPPFGEGLQRTVSASTGSTAYSSPVYYMTDAPTRLPLAGGALGSKPGPLTSPLTGQYPGSGSYHGIFQATRPGMDGVFNPRGPPPTKATQRAPGPSAPQGAPGTGGGTWEHWDMMQRAG